MKKLLFSLLVSLLMLGLIVIAPHIPPQSGVRPVALASDEKIPIYLPAPADIRDGTLDQGFGKGGRVITSFRLQSPNSHTTLGTAVVVQQDGKIVEAGYTSTGYSPRRRRATFTLARYLPTGALDRTFGPDHTGKIMTFFPDIDSGLVQANALALQPDGKLVAAGYVHPFRPDGRVTHPRFALVRYNPDGSLDQSFGKEGFVVTDFDEFSLGSGTTRAEANALVVEPDGHLVAAGFVHWNSATTNAQHSFVLVRYKPNGGISRVFGLTRVPGQNSYVIEGRKGRATSLVRQSDGKLVAAGYDGIPEAIYDTQFALARYNHDGTLDRSFGQNGSVLARFDHPLGGIKAEVRSLILQPDGKLVAAGRNEFRDGFTTFLMVGLMRLNPDGSLDQNFGSGGKVETNFWNRRGTANALIFVRDGRRSKLVVAGSETLGSGPRRIALARYHLDGSLDQSFGRGGIVITGFPPDPVEAVALAHYRHRGVNQLVAAGHVLGRYTQGFALTRYNNAATREELLVP
ncbi:MAG: hypothetical protein ACREEM_05480 [Blastocatellia bacterium]